MIAPMNSHRRLFYRTLAVVLLLAAGLKSRSLALSSSQGAVSPLPQPLLIALEVLVALWLAFGPLERARFLCGMTCFSLFLTVTLYDVTHSVRSCGCFGEAKISPVVTGSFDLCVLIALWLTRPRRTYTTARSWSPIKVIGGAAISALAATTLVINKPQWLSAAEPHAQPAVLNPAMWINQPLPLLNSIEGGDTLSRGRWLLIFYHFDCDACRQLLPTYRTIAEATRGKNASIRLAFVAIPPLASPSQDPGYASTDVSHFALRADRDWITSTPLLVALKDGRVVALDDDPARSLSNSAPQ
jgi:thiol-disulfide isomerase/thioredoxin